MSHTFKSSNDICQADLIKMHIATRPHAAPIAAHPYPLALKYHDFLKQDHDLNSKDQKEEFSSPFEPLSPVEQVTHVLIQVNEIFIVPDVEKLAQDYDALQDLPTVQTDKISRKCITYRCSSFRTKFKVPTRIHYR